MTNSLGHLSKLCQVFHLMICVTLGGFFPFSFGIFSQNPVWCSDGNAGMRNPYPTKSPGVIWEAKRGFSVLGRVCDFLLFRSFWSDLGGPNPPFAEVKDCVWPDEHAPLCISQDSYSIPAEEVSTGDWLPDCKGDLAILLIWVLSF